MARLITSTRQIYNPAVCLVILLFYFTYIHSAQSKRIIHKRIYNTGGFTMNDNTTNKVPNAAFAKTRDYFLGESLTPSENVPDLLAENRKIAISLAESVMSLMDVIANYC